MLRPLVSWYRMALTISMWANSSVPMSVSPAFTWPQGAA